MSWTYVYPGTEGSSDKDVVRLIVGDTISEDQLIADEEIDYYLSPAYPYTVGPQQVAWKVALSIAAKFSRLADKAIGDIKISMSQKAKQFKDLAALIKNEQVSGKPAYLPIRGEPCFSRNMMQNPAAGPMALTIHENEGEGDGREGPFNESPSQFMVPDVPAGPIESSALGYGVPRRRQP
jgi:hypothetical protein